MKDLVGRLVLVIFLLVVVIVAFFYQDMTVKKQNGAIQTEQNNSDARWELVQNSTEKDGSTVRFYILPTTIQKNFATDEVKVVLRRVVLHNDFMHSVAIEDTGVAEMFCVSETYHIGFYESAPGKQDHQLKWSPMTKVVTNTSSQILETLLCFTRV